MSTESTKNDHNLPDLAGILPDPQSNSFNIFGFAKVQSQKLFKTKAWTRKDHPLSCHPFLVKFGIFDDIHELQKTERQRFHGGKQWIPTKSGTEISNFDLRKTSRPPLTSYSLVLLVLLKNGRPLVSRCPGVVGRIFLS